MEEIILDIELPLDDHGFLDRQCPDERCRRYFKVLYSDWDASMSPSATCPFCGHIGESSDFNTDEQQSYFVEIGQSIMQERLQQMLGQFANSIRSKPSSKSLIKIDVTTKFNAIPVPVSPDAADSMRLQIACKYCGCTYAVVGAGFFCPLCGKNSAPHTLHQAVAKSRSAVVVAQNLDATSIDRDTVEAIRLDLFENQIEDLVTCFQRLADSIYPDLPSSTPIKNSPFQRLKDASDKWAAAGGRSFDSILNADEWNEILRYFQKRHVLAHMNGFVDSKYVAETDDRTYQVGQKLIVSAADVLRMADLVEKLASGMIDDSPSPASASLQDRPKPLPTLFPPQLPGTTELDWKVYQELCECAVENDHDNLHVDDVLPRLSHLESSEDDLADSLEILEAKGLVHLTHTIGSKVARHTRLTTKGLELYFSHFFPDYKERRKKIADLILANVSMSHVIAERTGFSMLFIHHIIRQFESRGLIKAQWSSGIAIVHATSTAQLKRLN